MDPLRYMPYEDTMERPNLVVDGAPNSATVLTISHWPGLATPPRCAADTSAQMAFRYLDRGADLHGDVDVVTNNHFDQDGLAAVYALTQPDDASARRAQLEDLASAGDFATYTDRSPARLSMAVASLADPDRSPLGALPVDYGDACAVLYEAALDRLPRWLAEPESCRTLWTDEDAQLEAGLAQLTSGAVTVAEYPDADLAVVTLGGDRRSSGHRFTGRTYQGIHPMALHRATERVTILLLDPASGRHRLTNRYEGWVQYRSRRVRPRTDLRLFASTLTAAEPAGATWTTVGPEDLTPELQTDPSGPPSSIPPAQLVAAVIDHLKHSPPAWDPFAIT